MSDQLDTSAVRRCAFGNIRCTDRVITQFYDEMLAPCGINVPQFGLLAALAEFAPITINRLAQIMVMDRTTLTRNLKLLIKQHLAHSEEGEDRRMRLAAVARSASSDRACTWW
jgi:DNA-binding MarR family transcriptional regulator